MKFNKSTYQAIAAFALAAMVFTGCQDNLLALDSGKPATETNDNKPLWVPGEAYIKLQPTSAPSTRAVANSVVSTATLAQAHVKVAPVFNLTGKYAEAARRMGLDRWYKLTFDEDANVQQILDELNSNKQVAIAHGGLNIVPEKPLLPTTSAAVPRTRVVSEAVNYFFNDGYAMQENADPMLRNQWHYENDNYADYPYNKIGADISLFKAWEKETGSEDLVVAIMDTGIDINHEDLQDAIWSGVTENGEQVNGWNFAYGNSTIVPGFHGTHVAGTIGAHSGNGVGVAGIAGGNGSKKGVRLMSCEIFGADKAGGASDKAASAGDIASAFQWAANHGASIINCSWGYEYPDDHSMTAESYLSKYSSSGDVIREGIRYFIKYAGMEPDGVTPRPNALMKGGLVFFGAGNSNARDIDIIPASYPEVIAVGAFTMDYKRASYSNTGSWVDILAPGGSTLLNNEHRGVLSTVPESFQNLSLDQRSGLSGRNFCYPENPKYAFFQGTSMATPHVTGIAALMVSHFGKKGDPISNDEIRTRLLGAVKAHSFEEEINSPQLKDKLGAGYIDAAMALANKEQKAPAAPTIQLENTRYYDATISWEVTGDEDAPTVQKNTFAYDVYLSSKALSEEELATTAPTTIRYSFEQAVGTKIEQKFQDLQSNTEYYVYVVARDRAGNKAQRTSFTFKTQENHVPTIVNHPGKITILNTKPYYAYKLKVKDADLNQTWTYKTSKLAQGTTIIRNDKDELELLIETNTQQGAHSIEITLTDNIGGTRVETIEYEIVDHVAPKLVGRLEDVSFKVNDKPLTLSLENIFAAAGNQTLTYSVTTDNPQVAEASIQGSMLTLTPHQKGIATIIVLVSDGVKKVQQAFTVSVNDDKTTDVYALYPQPAHSYMRILVRGGISIINVQVTSLRGQVLRNETLSVNSNTHEATLETDRLVPGTYYLLVKSGNVTSKHTFIKN